MWPTNTDVFNDSDFASLQDVENENRVASLEGTTERDTDDCQNTSRSVPPLLSYGGRSEQKVSSKMQQKYCQFKELLTVQEFTKGKRFL
jgi:hypothetical protein